MLPTQSTLKARLFDLTEERNALQEERDMLLEMLEEAREDARMYKSISDTRADEIYTLMSESRNKVDAIRLANDVSGAFRKQGIEILRG